MRNSKKEQDLLSVQDDIMEMKKELNSIQNLFMQLTERVIESYQTKSATEKIMND